MAEIMLNDGAKPVLVRGTDFQWEICKSRTVKNPKKDGEYMETWEPIGYFGSLIHCMDRIFDMKLRNSEARSLEELQIAVKEARKALVECYDNTLAGN